ncbi:MAG: ribulose-phosphate 3-epimerase [Candidatus Eisenbacteria sp.]|nr:ribulose-phosphate 3-epimerase [Candidatus Eisenbacteria bacterium]
MPQPRAIPAGVQVAPSLLAADFGHLAEEIRSIKEGGAAILHLDVMDGHFVPNITFGAPLVRSIRQATQLFLDTHLMIADPLAYLEPFARAGADLLTLHAEALAGCPAPTAAGLARLREAGGRLGVLGCRLGLSFRPATDPLPWLEAAGDVLDLVLIMTVEPGFGGQAFRDGQIGRLEAAARLREARAWRYRLEVDGGIDARTAGHCAAAGAELFVAGTAVFGRADRAAAMREILRAAEAAVGPAAG